VESIGRNYSRIDAPKSEYEKTDGYDGRAEARKKSKKITYLYSCRQCDDSIDNVAVVVVEMSYNPRVGTSRKIDTVGRDIVCVVPGCCGRGCVVDYIIHHNVDLQGPLLFGNFPIWVHII
jgi:hypothetical protein